MFRNVSILIFLAIFVNNLGLFYCYDGKDTYLNAYALSHGVSSLDHVNGNSDWDSTIWKPAVPYSNQQFYQRPNAITYKETGPGQQIFSSVKRLFDNIPIRFDVVTVLKFMLKILLFKKIVSFFGILWLMLFMPYLTATTTALVDDSGSSNVSAETDVTVNFDKRQFKNNGNFQRLAAIVDDTTYNGTKVTE